MNILRRFKIEAETGTAEVTVCHRDALAVGSQNGPADEQAQARAFTGPAALCRVETVEDERPVLFSHTRTAVFDDHLDLVAAFDAAG